MRRKNMDLNNILIVLAMIEIGAINTPYFKGIPSEELIEEIIWSFCIQVQKFHTEKFYNNENSDLFLFLSKDNMFRFDPEQLKSVFYKIKEQGADNYEFGKFDRMD